MSIFLQVSLPQLGLSRDEDTTTVDSDCPGRSFLKPTFLNNLFKLAYWSYSFPEAVRPFPRSDDGT